jgi:hypothetical protein
MVTPSDFDWCQIVTVAGTENNRRGTQTHSQPAQKMEPIIGADYCLSLLFIFYISCGLSPFENSIFRKR